jgi:hypothetical protein
MSSLTVSPDEITARTQLSPDETKVRGSSVAWQDFPRFHLWTVRSGCPDTADLDTHFAALVERIAPCTSQIRAFLESSDSEGCFSVVRKFEAGPELDAIADIGRIGPGNLERLRGQHPLLGFALDGATLDLAHTLGVGFGFDEYGDEYE